VNIGDIVYIDEFHISHGQKGTYNYMLCIDGKSGYMVVAQLHGMNINSIMITLTHCLNEFNAKGVGVKKIKWDNLPAHELVGRQLVQRGILVDFCAPGRHVRQVESMIRHVKDGFMATL